MINMLPRSFCWYALSIYSKSYDPNKGIDMNSKLRISVILLSSLLFFYDVFAYESLQGGAQGTCVQSGIASWYGVEEQGKLTANGETFDRHKFTAASRHLPFNTVVRVTNQNNGRSVEVRINDRGPYAKGRVLDLSEAASTALKMKTSGVAPVDIEVMQPAAADFGNSVSP
jgi:rare lipoprotein A (peptidoglycan hydrolase)